MFEVTTCEVCETCEEITPHSRRRVAVPKLVTVVLFAAGVAAAIAGRMITDAWITPAALAFGVALAVLIQDRNRHWGIACERCRSKRIAAEKPERAVWLNGRNIIDF